MIVFVIDRDLEVYDYTKSKDLKLVYKLERTKHTLELSTLFEQIWQELWAQGISQATEILYIVGENASFTDNRMVFIWIKSWRFFGGGNYYCTKFLSSQLGSLSTSLPELLEQASLNPEDLDYLKEPRITVKSVFGS